jgi:hypothetical protein
MMTGMLVARRRSPRRRKLNLVQENLIENPQVTMKAILTQKKVEK